MQFEEDTGLADRMLQAMWKDLEGGDLRLGLHASDLIYCLTKAWYKRKEPVSPLGKSVGFMASGIGLEAVLLSPHKRHFHEVIDEIHLTADFLSKDLVVEKFGELKTTRMAPNNLPYHSKTFELNVPEGWQHQIMSYMKALKVNTMVLAIFHVIPAQMKVWHVTCTDEEIEANWEWMLARKEVLVEALDKPGPPTPFQFRGFEAECKGCEYAFKCGAWKSAMELYESVMQEVR